MGFGVFKLLISCAQGGGWLKAFFVVFYYLWEMGVGYIERNGCWFLNFPFFSFFHYHFGEHIHMYGWVVANWYRNKSGITVNMNVSLGENIWDTFIHTRFSIKLYDCMPIGRNKCSYFLRIHTCTTESLGSFLVDPKALSILLSGNHTNTRCPDVVIDFAKLRYCSWFRFRYWFFAVDFHFAKQWLVREYDISIIFV